MIEQLFGSKTRVKLLNLFFSNPNRSFYVREITRRIDEQINSVRRELSNLLSIGIIRSDEEGNRLYYEVNQKYEHYGSLHAIFTNTDNKKERAANKEGQDNLSDRFARVGNLRLVLLTGDLLREPAVPVEVLVVGDVNRKKLEQLMTELEAEEGRELRYAVLGTDEFDYRLDLNDRFLGTILGARSTMIIGELPQESSAISTKKTAKKA